MNTIGYSRSFQNDMMKMEVFENQKNVLRHVKGVGIYINPKSIQPSYQ